MFLFQCLFSASPNPRDGSSAPRCRASTLSGVRAALQAGILLMANSPEVWKPVWNLVASVLCLVNASSLVAAVCPQTRCCWQRIALISPVPPAVFIRFVMSFSPARWLVSVFFVTAWVQFIYKTDKEPYCTSWNCGATWRAFCVPSSCNIPIKLEEGLKNWDL